MSRIDHISDLHFGRASSDKVEALLAQLNREAPDLVVVSGDLTQRARAREFESAGTFLSALSSPYLAVPGNHDIPLWQPLVRFANPWRRWKQFISRHQGYAGVSSVDGGAGPVVVQAATPVSERLRGEVNGYNRIHVTPGGLDIEILQWRRDRFVMIRSHRFRKTAGLWAPV